MYYGIEIDHPVFRVLFCNLIVAFISSVVNVIAYPIETDIKYSTIVNGNNSFCLFFHCCCWLIVSVLRYIYIIHKDWLLRRFPNPKTMNKLAVASVFTIYLAFFSIVVVVCMLCGWPQQKIFEMPMPQRAISAGAFFGSCILLIFFSCPFNLLILRKRGRLRNNKVGIDISALNVQESAIEMAMTNHFGNVRIGDLDPDHAYRQVG
jgi:hypothetical protein